MKNKLIKIITIVTVILNFCFPAASSVYAEVNCLDICAPSCTVPAEIKAASGCSGPGATNSLDATIVTLLSAIIGALGLVAVVTIVIGGINYMTSAGDAQKLKKAKDTILYACIGLAICAVAFAATNFAINIINSSSTPSSSESGES